MSRLRAKNDRFIEMLIEDPAWQIREDGTIWTTLSRNGKSGTVWRQAGRTDKEGYREIHYKHRRLKVHRIIYRKFNGPLDPYLIVDHGDRNTGNNRPGNLTLVTPKTNNEYRFRRQEVTLSEEDRAA